MVGTVFGAGLYVAMSPCLFPLLPLFLMRSLNSVDSRRRGVLVSAVLVLGILSSLAVFILVAQFVSLFLLQHFTQIQAVLGVFIAFFGILTMSERLRNALGISMFSLGEQPEEPTGLLGVYVVGLGYSLLAAPCSGTTIVGLVLLLGGQSNPLLLALMFAVMAVAVAIPYLAIAVVTGEARLRMTASLAANARRVEVAAGALLFIVGVILVLPLFGIKLL